MIRPDTTPQLFCSGVLLGRFVVPAFKVRVGDLLKLEFPDSAAGEGQTFVNMLSRPGDRGPVTASAHVEAVRFASESAVRRLLRRQRAADWLRSQTGMKPVEADSLVASLGIDPHARLASLAGTPRWLLGFQAALAAGADIIVFQTAGLDPLGVERALSAVDHQRNRIGAVYVSRSERLHVSEPAWTAVLKAALVEQDASRLHATAPDR
ncbi:MAG: hypothetical protein KY476_03310 [Planctomycetes bacterium]|nr:hypothetical protein [Planctomycetota bacterium]